MTSTTPLHLAAAKLSESLGQMRALLPGLADQDIFKVAEALNGNGLSVGAPPDPDAPATLAEAAARILKKAGQARRGEIRRAIETNCWSYLAGDIGLDNALGRVLTGNFFERVHRGLYRLAPVTPPASDEPAWGEEAALEHARKLPTPFRASMLAKSMHQNVFQVSSWLKALRAKKLVKHAGTDVNGTHDWEVV